MAVRANQGRLKGMMMVWGRGGLPCYASYISCSEPPTKDLWQRIFASGNEFHWVFVGSLPGDKKLKELLTKTIGSLKNDPSQTYVSGNNVKVIPAVFQPGICNAVVRKGTDTGADVVIMFPVNNPQVVRGIKERVIRYYIYYIRRKNRR